MSVSKKENKEDAVQLTQEDIQILSEYSWDMREYTSRFGFFYSYRRDRPGRCWKSVPSYFQ